LLQPQKYTLMSCMVKTALQRNLKMSIFRNGLGRQFSQDLNWCL